MAMYLASTAQIRRADEIQIFEKRVPGIILMEQAGRLAAEFILDNHPEQHSYLIAAGPGNNGGDGLVIARYLHLAGKEVQVLLSHPTFRYKGDALINYQIIAELPIPLILYGEEPLDSILSSFKQSPILIDALLGTGIQQELREPVATILRDLDKRKLTCIAIDLPSGLGAHTGELINKPIKAEHTLTFQLPKICHAVMPAKEYCGETEVIDIGIWPEVIERLGIRRRVTSSGWVNDQLKDRPQAGHKGTFGHLLLAGGSTHMPGSISMSTYASIRSGLGLATTFCPEECKSLVLHLSPESMAIGIGGNFLNTRAIDRWDEALKGKQAVVLGPGMGNNEQTFHFLKEALPMIQVPLLLDADALNLLAAYPELWALLPDSTVLTPHPGEMKRLTGLENVNDRRLETAERLAQDRGVVLVLKGNGSIIALPDGRTFVNPNGNPGMGTAGSGDVLAGLIGALLAQGYEAGLAAVMGTFLHGKAGDLAANELSMERMTAMDIADRLFVDKL